MGIDPVTHKPKSSDSLGPEQMKDAANLSHMAQWESARLEAEARLVRVSSNLPVSNPFQTHLGHSASPQLLNNVTAFVPQQPSPPRPQSLCPDVLTAWRGAASTLNFSQNPFPIPADGPILVQNSLAGSEYISNFSACQAMAMKIEAEIGKLMNNGVERFHNMDDYYIDGGCIKGESLKTEKGNGLLLPNFIEGLTDILLESSNTNVLNGDNNNVSGDFEEDKTYWNSVLNNLVNCSPFGSPVF